MLPLSAPSLSENLTYLERYSTYRRPKLSFVQVLIVSNPKKTNERAPRQAHLRSSKHIRKPTNNFSCELLFLDPHQFFVSGGRGGRTPELSVTSLFIYLHATPRADEFLRRAFPATFSSGLQRSLSILSGTEAISLWPKEKLGGRKKKRPAYLRASQTEQVWVQQMQTQFWNPQYAIHPSRDNWTQHLRMLLPNQPGEICLLLTQNKLQQRPTSTAADFHMGRFSLHIILNSFFPLWREDVSSGSLFGEVGFFLYGMWIQNKNGCCPRNFGNS